MISYNKVYPTEAVVVKELLGLIILSASYFQCHNAQDNQTEKTRRDFELKFKIRYIQFT